MPRGAMRRAWSNVLLCGSVVRHPNWQPRTSRYDKEPGVREEQSRSFIGYCLHCFSITANMEGHQGEVSGELFRDDVELATMEARGHHGDCAPDADTEPRSSSNAVASPIAWKHADTAISKLKSIIKDDIKHMRGK